MLIDSPRKFIVEFPSNQGHDHGEKGYDNRHGQQIWLHILPYSFLCIYVSNLFQILDGVIDLVILNRSINKHSDIVDAKTDDLNGILQSEGIVHKDQLIQETENK